MENWSKILTPDGYIGYVQNKILTDMGKKEYSGDKEQPVYKSTRLDEKIVLGWHQVMKQDGNKTLASVVAKTKGLNVISPTWFSITDNEGNYTSLASRDYVDQAHSMGLQVWALVDNFSKDVQTEVLLASTSTRKKLINNLMNDVEMLGLDGLNLDFEGLKQEAGVHYIQFLRELSIPCREKGIVLSVDNYVPTASTEFYDREEQGVVVDYLIVMGYDEHYNGSEAGSVASYEFVQNGIEGTLEQNVPAEKIINGVPFYTRLWTVTATETKSSAMGIADAKSWVKKNDIELTWLDDLGQFYGEKETKDGIQYLWMEEEDSLKEKMDLIKTHDLAGVACWKLGLEDEAAWDSISWD
jgi:spore germination protein YaaH